MGRTSSLPLAYQNAVTVLIVLPAMLLCQLQLVLRELQVQVARTTVDDPDDRT